jgi:hypothetical protein
MSITRKRGQVLELTQKHALIICHLPLTRPARKPRRETPQPT